MSKIIGNTTATPNPQPDWNQADPTKADYIKNKPIIKSDSTTEDCPDFIQTTLGTLTSTCTRTIYNNSSIIYQLSEPTEFEDRVGDSYFIDDTTFCVNPIFLNVTTEESNLILKSQNIEYSISCTLSWPYEGPDGGERYFEFKGESNIDLDYYFGEGGLIVPATFLNIPKTISEEYERVYTRIEDSDDPLVEAAWKIRVDDLHFNILPASNYQIDELNTKLDNHINSTKDALSTKLSVDNIDSTLTQSDQAADAKSTGDKINELKNLIGDIPVAEQISNAVTQNSQVQIITWEADD